MVKYIKNLFNSLFNNLFNSLFKQEIEDTQTAKALFNNEETKSQSCASCEFLEECIYSTGKCVYALELDNFDPSKDTLLIVDDNPGMVSFLTDDVLYLQEQEKIPENINILTITGKDAAFNFKATLHKFKDLNIKWCILDITLGGSQYRETGIVKYTGVDIFELIYLKNNDINVLFYTGNNLNPYIKSNKNIIEQFKKITNEDIMDFVLFKTSMDMDSRREYIHRALFV